MCNTCHDTSRVFDRRRTKEEWQNVLLKMIELGAAGGESDFETILAYLCLVQGQVYINHAPAPEIAMTLGLASKDADAIVAYRTKVGPFANIDALKKVPDIDVKKVDAHRDAILF
jgi:competence ComEA-like helix-hairpin-helix protein